MHTCMSLSKLLRWPYAWSWRGDKNITVKKKELNNELEVHAHTLPVKSFARAVQSHFLLFGSRSSTPSALCVVQLHQNWIVSCAPTFVCRAYEMKCNRTKKFNNSNRVDENLTRKRLAHERMHIVCAYPCVTFKFVDVANLRTKNSNYFWLVRTAGWFSNLVYSPWVSWSSKTFLISF